MKLELKHILPYLNHELKAQDIRTKEIRTVTLLHFTYDKETVGHNHLIYEGLLLSKHLPILRPLSDLTKEIEVNGEKFVPIEKVEQWNTSINFAKEFEALIEDGRWISTTSYILVELLLKWHFDIFELIENGLAIDINTL